MRNIPRYIPHIIFSGYWRLLPLNGCWWLGGAVVDYTIDALNIINDLIGDLGEELVWELRPIGRHCIDGGDSSQGTYILVSALVAHHTN